MHGMIVRASGVLRRKSPLQIRGTLHYDYGIHPDNHCHRRCGSDRPARRALAVDGDVIAAIGPTEDLLRAYPQAEVYNGRGKALLPGLINCHAHLTATLNRGITEDFGFRPPCISPWRRTACSPPKSLPSWPCSEPWRA